MNSHTLNFEHLKDRHREVRDSYSQSLGVRTHRALSWLQKAEQEAEDPDARFIFLWIAFNAAYAQEIEDRQELNERQLLLEFIRDLISLDQRDLLYSIVWKRYSGPIRTMIDNKYVFQPFWDYLNGRIPESVWETQFERSKAAAMRALSKMNTERILTVVFDRLYTLRNQLIHGGATWSSSVNRSQVSDGASILGSLVPTIIHLMMENPDRFWRDPCYPVVD